MLGAAWLVAKTEGDARELGYRVLPRLLAGLLVFLVVAFAAALGLDLAVMRRWQEVPGLAVFPALGAAAVLGLVYAIRRRLDPWPFPMGVAIFAAAFGTLVVSFLPYMIPFSVTIAEAAAPPSSLAFLFWGAGVFVLPITLVYTGIVYFVFRGKAVVESRD